MKLQHPLLALCLLFSISACESKNDDDNRYPLMFSALSDDGTALPGVTFTTTQGSFGDSDAKGELAVSVRGQEGRVLPVDTKCPEGFDSPARSQIRLAKVKSLDGSSIEPISLQATCIRKTRDIVLVVHAENGAALPITVNGQQSGTTDENGNAHFSLGLDRETKRLSVRLDTSAYPLLKPENPSRVFEINGKDTVAIFNQPLTKTEAPKVRRRNTAPARHVPYRVN